VIVRSVRRTITSATCRRHLPKREGGVLRLNIDEREGPYVQWMPDLVLQIARALGQLANPARGHRRS
jgi:hypothetical protein